MSFWGFFLFVLDPAASAVTEHFMDTSQSPANKAQQCFASHINHVALLPAPGRKVYGGFDTARLAVLKCKGILIPSSSSR